MLTVNSLTVTSDSENSRKFETMDCDIQASTANGEFDVIVDGADNVCGANERRQLYLNNVICNNFDDERSVELEGIKDYDRQLIESSQNNRMRVALGILLRLVLPLANGFAKGLRGIRDVRFLEALKSLASSRQSLTNVLAYAANTISMSLSSVQVAHRIDPLLKLMKLRRGSECIESLPDIPSVPSTPTMSPITTPLLRQPMIDYSPPTPTPTLKTFCTISILAEPPAGTPIRADIVLIHGLHGSQANTWKQGLWNSSRRPVNFQRPPKPPLRPPKRPRHSRSNIFIPPHTMKRARIADQEHFSLGGDSEPFADYSGDTRSYSFDSSELTRFDGIEYSFPTFRLRVDENDTPQPSSSSEPSGEPKTPTDKSSDYSTCWPRDWLPLDCPGVRVIAVNYTTDPYLWRPVWKQKESRTNLVERAREMTELLIEKRVGYGHPIVWVGHSKGGVFLKQIIVDAWESGRPTAAPLWRSARGVFFYSVPHRGSHLASINAPFLRRSIELIDIEKNNKYLLDLHRRFAGLYQLGHLKIEVFSFVETALTLMSVLYLRIIGADSADPGIGEVCGLHLDHREICKPRSRDCILYKELVNMINNVC